MTRATLLLAALCLAAAPAAAAENQEELIEKVVVRNRLYTLKGRLELGLNVGFMPMSRLTDHVNFNGHFAYNLSDTLALEVRGGYALGPASRWPTLSHHTNLAGQIAEELAAEKIGASSPGTVSDLSDLWEMHGNAAVGVRWAPIYGKISLMAELPLHFQAYLWLGGGAVQLHRESVMICNQKSGSSCAEFYTQDKFDGMASVALGTRFFLTPSHSIAIELRDYSYRDEWLADVDYAKALNRSPPDGGGTAVRSGLTNLVMIDIGYSFLF
ncbi:MAG: outer membrane beta-barrel domain-containing protein [Myxococcales bacterium]|nr:outer membrane beta-barrel domain-containing protein [Myxococcales bacterium]